MRRRTHPKSSWTFFRQWLRNPLRVAAVAPSGADLAAAMIAELPVGTRRVIELGGGTGAITRALLAHGILGRELLVLELEEELHEHLHARFPQVRIVLGDARDVVRVAEREGYLGEGLADAVVSGLGLLTMSREAQRELLDASFACLREGGRFLQFTYGPQSPVADGVVEALGLEVRRGEFILRNVPPATVYVFERARR